MNKENKSKIEALLKKVANARDLKICSLNIQTSQNPTVVKITIKKTNGDDISLEDCASFNTPASEEVENSIDEIEESEESTEEVDEVENDSFEL